MASAERGGGSDAYDVYVSYPNAEVGWARRLIRDLSEHGLRCFADLDLRAGELWQDTMSRALEESTVLVVLWSPASAQAAGMLSEIAGFEALVARGEQRHFILPVMLGGHDLLGTAPKALSSRQALFIDRETYGRGWEAESEDWTSVIDAIVRTVKSIRDELAAGPSPMTTAPSKQDDAVLSRSARTALTYAAEMLDYRDDSPVRLRTAALLGALLASATGEQTPTTGDVLALVMGRQPPGRTALQVVSEAAAVVQLRAPARKRRALDVEALMSSPAAPLVELATEAYRITESRNVSLRHVLAVGMSAAIPPDVLGQLGAGMPELRASWKASLARTWPSESQEGWDRILRESYTGGPPSALVHADRWTTEDRLDYALYAKAIAEFIRHKDAKPPMVISVQAPWGQGKTSLMRMVQKHLDAGHPDLVDKRPSQAREPSSEVTFGELRDSLDGAMPIDGTKPQAFRTVWFNAWKYQSSEQIWAGLAHAILAQLPARLSTKDRELFWLQLQIRRIDPSAVRADIYKAALDRFLPRIVSVIALVVVALVVLGIALLSSGFRTSGISIAGGSTLGSVWLARRAWIRSTAEALERPLEGAYLRYVRQPDYSSRLGYLHLVEEDMANALDLLTPDDQPTVVFIDDLDRCSPGRIGEVIEAVNLFLAGEYPNCAFVIGVDAEVVAASMEVVHAEIIDKLDNRRGELGWRFMDKFVQLPFVMPRLHPRQREMYLRGLFSTAPSAVTHELLSEAERLEGDVRDDALPVDELARRAAELAPRLGAVAPDRARTLGEEIVSAGARAFSDDDPEVVQALADQMRYLSDNPRTIKRAVNLYRFHRFTAFARQASTTPLEVATPAQIGRWVVVIVRWPQFVRWLQVRRDEDDSGARDPAMQVLELASRSDDMQTFKQALIERGINAGWTDDAELLEFLREDIRSDLRLDLAGPRGLW